MKYFLIFLISFAFVNPALAVKQVRGSIPSVQPLQPPPATVSPNISNNIQYSDPSHPNQLDSQGNSTNAGSQSSASNQPVVKANSQPQAALAQTENGHNYFGWIVVLLALGTLGFVWYKQRKI